nr:hypothetical protein [Tanacetum cinerariifolium]
MYVCLAVVREEFLDRCRKYLGLDGYFLKGVVKGMLLTAVGKDANNQMFPLEWGIVETESQSSWTWFLKHLKVDINTKDGGEWTFMSDKQKGLLNAVQAIFPQAQHRLCARHIYANWYSDFRGEQMKLAFYSAANLDEEIIEDGTVELRRTQVRFPRALLKYAVQEKRDYIFKENA